MATIEPFKDRLMGALHTAVQYFNTDNNPNDAVVKSARDNDFNAEQTTRLVEMFNTARTLYHYKSASDRTAQFALADADSVLPALFDVKPKVETKTAQFHDYSEYNLRERNYLTQDTMEKAAAVMPVPTEGMLSLEAISGQAMRAVRSLRQVAKIAEDEARVAAHQASRIFTKLAGEFALGFGKDDQYARLVVGYKDQPEWSPVVTKLAEFVPDRHKPAQSLIDGYKRASVIDDRDLSTHIEMMKEAREWLEVEE